MDVSIAVPETALETMTAEWLCRIRGEYTEVPGLSLTRQQAKRLWRLDDAMVDRVLQALVDVRFLRRTATGSYVRAD